MKKLIAIMMLLALGLGAVACGSKEKPGPQPHPEVPNWYLDRSDQNPLYVFAYGQSSRHSNRNAAEGAAKANARADMALFLAGTVRTMTESYLRSIAGNAALDLDGFEQGIRQTANARLSGMRFDGANARFEFRTHPDGGYDVFVRGFLDTQIIKDLAKELTQSSGDLQRALERYNVERDRFLGEMDKRIEEQEFKR